MEKMKVLNTKGEKVSDVKLNETVWAIEPNDTVLYDAITLTRNAERQGTADTKTRSEVSGGGRKPWKPFPLVFPVTSTTSPSVKISALISYPKE